jgi:hypothetical protein
LEGKLERLQQPVHDRHATPSWGQRPGDQSGVGHQQSDETVRLSALLAE